MSDAAKKMEADRLAVHFSSKSDDWATPQAFFDQLNRRFGPFDLDVCATAENAKCLNFASVDGLVVQERGDCSPGMYCFASLKDAWQPFKRCWMNPPYGRGIGAWVKKAYEESQKGCLVVCLLPARTDTKWFHDYCTKGEIEFIKGRLKFGQANNSAPFPSMVVVFRPKEVK